MTLKFKDTFSIGTKPSGEINNQNKTFTQNGVYTADAGYTGLGTVTVDVTTTTGETKYVPPLDMALVGSAVFANDSMMNYRGDSGVSGKSGLAFPLKHTLSDDDILELEFNYFFNEYNTNDYTICSLKTQSIDNFITLDTYNGFRFWCRQSSGNSFEFPATTSTSNLQGKNIHFKLIVTRNTLQLEYQAIEGLTAVNEKVIGTLYTASDSWLPFDTLKIGYGNTYNQAGSCVPYNISIKLNGEPLRDFGEYIPLNNTNSNKVYNFDSFGLINTGGVLTGFFYQTNYRKYAQITSPDFSSATSFEIKGSYTMVDKLNNTEQHIIAGTSGYNLFIIDISNDGYLQASVPTSATSWASSTIKGSTLVPYGQKIYFKLVYNSGTYELLQSLDGETYTSNGTLNAIAPTHRNNDKLNFGVSRGFDAAACMGTIDMNDWSITIDGEKVWEGVTNN